MGWRLVGPDEGSVLGRTVLPPGAATAVTERAARATAPTASGAASLLAHLPMVDLVTVRSCHIGARPGPARSGDSHRRSALLRTDGSRRPDLGWPGHDLTLRWFQGLPRARARIPRRAK